MRAQEEPSDLIQDFLIGVYGGAGGGFWSFDCFVFSCEVGRGVGGRRALENGMEENLRHHEVPEVNLDAVVSP